MAEVVKNQGAGTEDLAGPAQTCNQQTNKQISKTKTWSDIYLNVIVADIDL